jgi:hypothetical protein
MKTLTIFSRLRSDPALKLACGRLPDTGRDLCSQPTVSRRENAPNLRDLIRLTGVMIDLYCASYTKPPDAVTLARRAGYRDGVARPARFCRSLPRRDLDPPCRGGADADGAVNDGATVAPVTRPANLQRLSQRDQSQRRNRRLDHSRRRRGRRGGSLATGHRGE